jgi:hypothetical protein
VMSLLPELRKVNSRGVVVAAAAAGAGYATVEVVRDTSGTSGTAAAPCGSATGSHTGTSWRPTDPVEAMMETAASRSSPPSKRPP